MVDDGGLRDDAKNGRRMRRVIVCAVGVIGVFGATMFVGSVTHWFGLKPDARLALAITACEDAVRQDLSAPSTARFDGMRVKEDALTEDDHVNFGFDASRVRAIWAVYGTVASQDKSGKTADLEFACRAAFFDGQATRTSINYGSADLPGQLAARR